MEVVDIVLFNGEFELLELRMNILDNVVDRFIIKEATETFQGNPRELCFPHIEALYDPERVSTCVLSFPEKIDTWGRDNYQRAYPVDLDAYGVGKDALILTSELDEVPNPDAVEWLRDNYEGGIYKFEQFMHQYWLNVQNVSEPWTGTRASDRATYELIDAQKQRYNHEGIQIDGAGWHWSFLGGEEAIVQKIMSYAHAEYNNEATLSKIRERLMNNEDVFNRGFELVTRPIDDFYPKYVRDNQESLSHLIRPLE